MAQHLSSKNLFLSSSPLTVGVASDPAVLAELLSLDLPVRRSLCDVIELRLDLLKLPPEKLKAMIEGIDMPLLITARHPAEGGQGPEAGAARLAMLEPLLSIASIVDIELRSVPDMAPLISAARAQGVGVLGSFHDFQATPGDEVLAGAIEFAQQAGLGGVKLATYLNGPEDLQRLQRIVTQKHRLPLSVMGMGPLGRVSRLVLAKLGSLLNYGFLGESNAPGQWPVARLKQLLAEL
jgi:3-dehydroquinate dehydratase-1